jgi:hypothetical protein
MVENGSLCTISVKVMQRKKNLRGVVDHARKKNNLNHFIHFQLQNNAPHMPSNYI